METRIGKLEFKDGAPSVATAEKIYDTLDFTRGLDAFLNSYGGASAYAIRKGLLGIGAEDNTVTIYPELMDAKSLFLTANADTVYYFSAVDLTKGPMVVEQPPKGLGTINDMWFGWIIDVGFPGPDRGEGGRYLLLPPGYDGPLPDGGFYVARSKTTRVHLRRPRFPRGQRSEAGRREHQENDRRFIRTHRAALARASRPRSKARSGSKPIRPFRQPSSWRPAAKRSIRSLQATIRSSR